MAENRGNSPVTQRVRGKRYGAPREKGRAAKRRHASLRQRPGALHAAQRTDKSVRRPKRAIQKASVELCALERLPAEIVQHIFELSANVDLPVASPTLKEVLSESSHMQRQLATELLTPILGRDEADVTKEDIRQAVRLLNCRFMTWQFFCGWVRDFTDTTTGGSGSTSIRQLWESLRPSAKLCPPKKLFTGPFDTNKVSLLSVLSISVHDIGILDPLIAERAYHGLNTAVRDRSFEATRLLLRMGVKPDNETLRLAVIEAGCQQDIVQLLLGIGSAAAKAKVGPYEGIDFLDTALWSWAEWAKARDDASGEWLLQRLRDAQSTKGRE